ncbi:Hypothetical predicted protein [Octopus vulgaris]|uniref:Uncharacterized protein n=1 Tax=Octopus vulgaris TaxID=6645 RepID=A0AA36BUZ5_OCTVU|nr:Hypothetical predicted protein [Octopus vulgaris]
MYKFMLIAALFVAGAYGECNTDVAIGCLAGKINEVATNLNRSDLCSDLTSVAHCMTAAGCAGDAGFLTSMCEDASCNVNVGTECILRLSAGLGILSSGAAALFKLNYLAFVIRLKSVQSRIVPTCKPNSNALIWNNEKLWIRSTHL